MKVPSVGSKANSGCATTVCLCFRAYRWEQRAWLWRGWSTSCNPGYSAMVWERFRGDDIAFIELKSCVESREKSVRRRIIILTNPYTYLDHSKIWQTGRHDTYWSETACSSFPDSKENLISGWGFSCPGLGSKQGWWRVDVGLKVSCKVTLYCMLHPECFPKVQVWKVFSPGCHIRRSWGF